MCKWHRRKMRYKTEYVWYDMPAFLCFSGPSKCFLFFFLNNVYISYFTLSKTFYQIILNQCFSPDEIKWVYLACGTRFSLANISQQVHVDNPSPVEAVTPGAFMIDATNNCFFFFTFLSVSTQHVLSSLQTFRAFVMSSSKLPTIHQLCEQTWQRFSENAPVWKMRALRARIYSVTILCAIFTLQQWCGAAKENITFQIWACLEVH